MKNLSLVLGCAFAFVSCGTQVQRSELNEDKKPKEWYEDLKSKKDNEKDLTAAVKGFTDAMLEGGKPDGPEDSKTLALYAGWVGTLDDGKECNVYVNKGETGELRADLFSVTREKGKGIHKQRLAGIQAKDSAFHSFRNESTKDTKNYTLAANFEVRFDENGKNLDIKKTEKRLYVVNVQVSNKGERTFRILGNNLDSKYESRTCKGLKLEPEEK